MKIKYYLPKIYNYDVFDKYMATFFPIKNPLQACNNSDLPEQEIFPYVSLFLTVFVLIFYILSMYHAAKKSKSHLSYLVSASIFGYILEIAMISITKSYCYNPRWLLLIGPVPLAIALSWGILIYTTRLIIEQTNLSLVTGALFQAFFTVILDFILDPLAVRFSLWTWALDIDNTVPDFTKDYFGIPWGNYWGWHWAIFSYSIVFQLISRYMLSKGEISNSKAIFNGVLSIIIGMAVGFIIIMAFGQYEKIVPSSLGQSIVIVLLVLIDILLVIKEKMYFTNPIGIVPKFIYISYYLLFSVLWIPIATTLPILIVIILLCGVIVAYVLWYLPRNLNGHD